MKKTERLLFVCLTALLLMSLSACRTGGKSSAPEQTPGSPEKTEPAPSESETDPEEAEKGDTLTSREEALCGSYFKAGSFAYKLNITPGNPEDRSLLRMTFSKRDGGGWSNSLTALHEFELPFHEAGSYDLKDESSGGGTLCPIRIYENGSISLYGDGEGAGDYYSYKGSLFMPEAFERPLNDTDLLLLTKEDCKLLRNEFYAVYGREFKDPGLKGYFEAKPWYQGSIGADKFDEALLGGLDKRNIAFLKHAEEVYDDKQAGAAKKAYAALEPAPYLKLLPTYGETAVTIDSSPEQSEDKGLYYRAQGTISVPITITAAQYKVLEAGGSIELTVDELTGATKILKKTEHTQDWDYVLLDTADSTEESGWFAMASWVPESGFYQLWENSVDTLFKRVYEGEIRVLKGACEEYYRYFDMKAEEHREGPGSFRSMDFTQDSTSGPEPYSGNILVADEKGYVKALYFQGD